MTRTGPGWAGTVLTVLMHGGMMRNVTQLVLSLVVMASMLTLVIGCATDEAVSAGRGDADAAQLEQERAAAAAAQAHADRVAAAIARSSHGAHSEPPEVVWLRQDPSNSAQPGGSSEQAGEKPSLWDRLAAVQKAAASAKQPETPDEPVAATSAEPARTQRPQRAAARPLSTDELASQLLDRLTAGTDGPRDRAMAAAVLAAARGADHVDPAVLAGLDHRQKREVARLHQAVRFLRSQATQGDTLGRETVEASLDELFGNEPVTIENVAFCRKVMGYGVYEPFESTTFLAGRPQKMIVYVEVENFRTQERADGQYEVKLTQEVALYNDADGLAVWRHEPVQIVDVSRNRRRDFFMVQLVELPQRLSVGKYRMKVRITDQYGGSIDETTRDLQVVADASLVKGDGLTDGEKLNALRRLIKE